jgi:type I restriction enzyme S subunit
VLLEFRLRLLPLTEQRRIAAVLDKVGALQRKRAAASLMLDDLLRAAMDDVLGRRGSTESHLPIICMRDAVVDVRYGTSIKANREGRGLPVLRMNNLTEFGHLDLTDLKYCEIRPEDIPKYTVRRGDLLFNRTNSHELVGKSAVWDREETYAFAGYLIRLRFDETRLVPEYVCGYLNAAVGKRLLLGRAKASINMSNISAADFMRLPIPAPPLPLQQKYADLWRSVGNIRARMTRSHAAAELLGQALSQRTLGAQV